MNIVLIDSGIDNSHKIFEGINIVHYKYDCQSEQWKIDMNPIIHNGHGTGVASIIVNKLKDITIFSFLLFDENLQCSEENLISCLEYVYTNINCSLINMSLGTLKYIPELYHICQKIREKGTVLVAAFSNDGGISFPAAFDCVIGVDSSFRCRKSNEFVYVKNSNINIKAKGANQRVAWLNQKYIITQGVSYSCGYVSNYIIQLFEKGITKYEDILNNILINSIFVYDNVPEELKVNKVNFQKIAVYPYNKEISSIVNLALKYEIHISGIYEHPKLGHVGMMIESLYSDNLYKIQNINECNWEDFDLMVIGHLEEQENRLNISLKKEILDKCLQYHKNVYSLDMYHIEEYKDEFASNNLFLYYPEVIKNFNNTVNINRLFYINIPIVAIFGTSKQQGKFTIQLLLRKYLLEMGYRVGQIGTEPQSLLFGFDYVIPLGYESLNDMNPNELIPLVNYQLHEIEKKGADIILVGAQSGTIPRAFNNMCYFNSQILDFLCGVTPDAVILCINYHDELDYIKRTIMTIESLGDCKVIALCLFPLGFLNEWDLMNNKKTKLNDNLLVQKKKYIEQKLNVPVVMLGEKDMTEQIVQYLQAYFKEESYD